MQFHWNHTGCDEEQVAEIAEQWRMRQDQLEAKAELVGGDPSSPVVVAVEHSDAAPRWWMQVSLYAPEGSSVAEAEANELVEVIDRVIGEISQQIDRQAERPQEIAQRRRGLEGFAPLLNSYHSSGMSREFIALLTPVVASLRSYIGRELRARNLLGQIPPGRASISDIADDLLLRAWEQFGRRPDQQPLDIWLMRMIDACLDGFQQPDGEQSLEDRQPMPRVERGTSRESQQFESVEEPTEYESIALERLIPERSNTEPWDSMHADAKQIHLERLLHRLPQQQRHALMLQTVEGYDQVAIADLQGRSLGEVAADLAAAQQEVQRMVREEDYPELQEQLEREALMRPRRSHRT